MPAAAAVCMPHGYKEIVCVCGEGLVEDTTHEALLQRTENSLIILTASSSSAAAGEEKKFE